MIYGYPRRQVNEYGLQELNELTLAMGPAELRLLGKFLVEMAAEMEAGAFERTSHRHMTAKYHEWRTMHPSADVIIMPPPPRNEG
jgi:hypothetical protein